MSVIMTMSVQGDPAKMEQIAGENPDRIRSIAERAKGHGLIAHRFYGSDDGQIMVVDEWPDPGSFQQFFEEGHTGDPADHAGGGRVVGAPDHLLAQARD